MISETIAPKNMHIRRSEKLALFRLGCRDPQSFKHETVSPESTTMHPTRHSRLIVFLIHLWHRFGIEHVSKKGLLNKSMFDRCWGIHFSHALFVGPTGSVVGSLWGFISKPQGFILKSFRSHVGPLKAQVWGHVVPPTSFVSAGLK